MLRNGAEILDERVHSSHCSQFCSAALRLSVKDVVRGEIDLGVGHDKDRSSGVARVWRYGGYSTGGGHQWRSHE